MEVSLPSSSTPSAPSAAIGRARRANIRRALGHLTRELHRYLPDATVGRLVEQHTQGRVLGFLGEPRVNVLELNLALETIGR